MCGAHTHGLFKTCQMILVSGDKSLQKRNRNCLTYTIRTTKNEQADDENRMTGEPEVVRTYGGNQS